MKRIRSVGLIAFVLAAGALALAQTPSYVGPAKCQLCHKTETQGRQFPIWENSLHSKSFAALSSPAAAKSAQALGIQDPMVEPRCLKCHAPAAEIKSDGVSCEVCHGPGSEYKALSVMRAKDEAVKKGLRIYADAAAIQSWCLTCHKSAHNKTFDFAAAWDKIKHPVPAK